MSVLDLARPDILKLRPYQHAAWDPSLERMHANEMPWRATGDDSAAGLNRYPEPQPESLVARLAELYDVQTDRVLVGRGSDEAIDLLTRAFCRAGVDRVVTCPPTFGYYRVAAQIQGAEVVEVPLRADFSLDLPRVLAAGRDAKIVFLCSPNNPTGNLLDEGDMLALCTQLADSALVCVDEAYIEFADRPSLATRLAEWPNLVLLRTLSKAYALAGARCGALLADPGIVGLLQRIIPPYAIPAPTIEVVLDLTDARHGAEVRERRTRILDQRARLRAALERLPLVERVFASDANFLLVRCRDARRFMAAGRQTGLLVRDFSSHPGLAECLRVSVGTPEQNARLLAAVESA